MDLTMTRLREVLRYEPDTGHFYFVARVGNVPAGARAGCIQPTGYVRIGIDGRYYVAHRLAWLYAHGRWPDKFIDHINGQKSDNRLCNLRDVSREVNLQNQHKAHTNSATGLLGVQRSKNKFIARRTIDGRRIHLGTFADPMEAHQAWVAAAAPPSQG